jgi:hypothetical protein
VKPVVDVHEASDGHNCIADFEAFERHCNCAMALTRALYAIGMSHLRFTGTDRRQCRTALNVLASAGTKLIVINASKIAACFHSLT